MSGLLHKNESYQIMGACFKVYTAMGCGFLESVYQECLKMEFTARSIPFQSQVPVPVMYEGSTLETGFRADFVCYDSIILELKAMDIIADAHRAQVINYLRATGLRLGIILNFGHYPKLQYERFIVDQTKSVRV